MSKLNTIIALLVFISLAGLLNLIDTREYNKAVERCNGKDNVITSYTNQGDKYYSCKK